MLPTVAQRWFRCNHTICSTDIKLSARYFTTPLPRTWQPRFLRSYAMPVIFASVKTELFVPVDWRAHYRTWLAALWLWYMTAPTKLTPAAMMKTGNQRPWDCVTSSAVRGPHSMPGMVACKKHNMIRNRSFHKSPCIASSLHFKVSPRKQLLSSLITDDIS